MLVVLPLIGGMVLGFVFTLMARDLIRSKVLPAKKPIIHMCGHCPAWWGDRFCEYSDCGSYFQCHAAYVDQDGRYWCTRHLPKGTQIELRASSQPTEDGHCVIHDYKCPKPWELY